MLIGLNGAAGSGKDTVANFLVEDFGFKRYAFADAVREAALAIDPMIDAISWEYVGGSAFPPQKSVVRLSEAVNGLGWDQAKRDIPEVRRLLQVIGTEVGRQILGSDCWVEIVKRKWAEDGYPDAVITDMRFPNEYAWVTRQLFASTWKILRPENPDAISTKHVSEQHQLACDYTLVNEGSLEDLRAAVALRIRALREEFGYGGLW